VNKRIAVKPLLSAIVLSLALALPAGCSQQQETAKPASVATAFANPGLLTETGWLKEHLGEEGLVLLDARTPEEYAAGHIKGAVNFPAHSTDETIGGVPAMLTSIEKLAGMLGERGVTKDSNVIVYDMQITPPAGRLFWILEYLGHVKVSVLNGGMAKFKKEGGDVTKDVPAVAKSKYVPEPEDEALATKDEVREMMSAPDAVLVDTRPVLEYAGGHLKGAKRMDWVELLTGDDPPVMKPAAELDELFADLGVTRDKDVGLY